MRIYLNCRDCEGVGRIEGEDCPSCEGYGGYWLVLGPGIQIRVIPGDKDQKPEGP